MWWLDDIIVPAVLILGISCFVLLVRSSTRRSVRKNTRSAEDLYPLYADSTRKQRKYAKEHGGQWRDDEGSRRPRLSGQQRPACWQPEGISIRFPHDLHSNSTCLAPTAVRRCLLIRTPVPGLAGQSAWMRLGGQPPQKLLTRVPGDPSRAARLIPRIPGGCSVMAKMGSGLVGYAARTPRHWRNK